MKFHTLLLALLLLAFPGVAALHAATPRPNFLLILTDDHGYGDVSAYGAKDVQTPNIDRLASEGMLFTNMRANCTVCSPSRAAILTGLYADRAGVPGVIRTNPDNSWGYLAPGVATLGDRLRQAGYHTAAIGKWHLGLESPNTPNERGFDLFHGFLGDMMDSYLTHERQGNNYMRLNQETITPQGHATDLFSEWAGDYFKQRATQPNQPFFLYLAFNAPHFPIEPPQEWLDRVKQRVPGLDEKRTANVAFVEHLDDRIGRVLKALEETGLAKNTVVVFTADNGGSLPHGQSNTPWRGGKQDHYDGGLRVPFVVRWPGHIVPGAKQDYAGLGFDSGATFLELASVPQPEESDSVSLVPALKGEAMPAGRELYFVRREGGAEYGGKSYEAIIKDGWKLMQNGPYAPLELYHLEEDPEEQKNVMGKAPKVTRDLSTALRRHIQIGGAVPWQKP
ncbi:MAG: sulfatase [Verrucomicrobium sp.]|nr:sulfatase-like hydrolase/transferase [Verrucomicrobium sp.]